MKTIKLSTQLLILFTTVTILSAVVFGLVTYKNYEAIYQGIARSDLETYTKNITSDIRQNSDVEREQIEYLHYIFVDKTNLVIDISLIDDSITKKETNEVIIEMIEKALNDDLDQYESFITNENFFLYKSRVKNEEYVIGIMHLNYVSRLKKESEQSDILLSFLGTFVAFAVIIIVGNIILALWSRDMTKRINHLTNQVSDLSSTGYEKEIEVYGADEISVLSEQIEKMRVELKDNESTKQEMFQNLSHDFKTPISVIKSYAEAIEDGIVEPKDAKIIAEQTLKLQDKVMKLLEYNKLEYIDSKKAFEEVNMKNVITNVIQTYRILLSKLKLNLKLEDVYFVGFKENYITVVSNILDNAIRFAKTKISITLKDNYLSIYNDGIPIDEKYIEELFKPYEKGTRGQFGLGMSIVQKTVNRFGYRLKVENIDDGVKFTIMP